AIESPGLRRQGARERRFWVFSFDERAFKTHYVPILHDPPFGPVLQGVMHTMAPSGCSYEISHLRIFVLPSPSFQLSPCFVTVPEWHEFKSQIQPKNGHARTDYFPAWQSERTNVAAVAKYMAI